MNNGRNTRFIGYSIFGVLVLFVAISCRTSRTSNSTGEYRTTTAAEVSERHDTTALGQTSGLCLLDSTSEVREAQGEIYIERDSTGRATKIKFSNRFSGKKKHSSNSTEVKEVRGASKTKINNFTASADSITQEKKESQTKVNAGLSITSLIGSSILLLVILYVLYVIFKDGLWTWIKAKLKR